MKRIIAIISLVLMLALCLTSCSKKDYQADKKTFEYDNLKITLTDSFSEARKVDNGDKDKVNIGDLITYTSSTFTSVTVERLKNSIPSSLAAEGLEEIKALKLDIEVHKLNDAGAETASGATADGTTYYYFVFTVDEDGAEYTYLKAFMNEGEYSYSITFSATKSAYIGNTKRPDKDPGYQKYFIDWLNTATITQPVAAQ